MEISNGNWKMENEKTTIKSFQDLKVYQGLYKSMLSVLKDVIPYLPKEEKYDLKNQMQRCCKASPALIAEGFAKRYQKRSWQKYIDDTIGECNEMIHHLSVCLDVYPNFINKDLCKELINGYDIICRQLTNLKKSWVNFHSKEIG